MIDYIHDKFRKGKITLKTMQYGKLSLSINLLQFFPSYTLKPQLQKLAYPILTLITIFLFPKTKLQAFQYNIDNYNKADFKLGYVLGKISRILTP